MGKSIAGEPGCTISKKECEWLFKALSKDAHRPILSVAHVSIIDGVRYVVATDTHRVHVLNLGSSDWTAGDPILPGDRMLLDLRRILFEMRYHGKDAYLVDDIAIIKADEDMLKNPPLQVAGYSRVEGVYPPWERVIPKDNDEKKPLERPFDGELAINGRYLEDASQLSSTKCVFLHVNTQNGPIIVQEKPGSPWECRWFAVVMPMAME